MKNNFSFNAGKYKIIFAAAITALIMIKCKQGDEKNIVHDTIGNDTKFVSVSAVNIPDAPGADAFRTNCMICHSARYIQMQPEFPRKTWENIVNKMIKNYGAPIADSTAQNIVDYLTTIKGKK